MHDGHGCHREERSLKLEEVLQKEKIFKNPKTSLKEKNDKFDELYSKHGVSESRLYKSGDLMEDVTLKEACLKVEKKKFGEIWEKSDEVLNYHFRNLKKKPTKASLEQKGDYFKYLKTKCQRFLDRKVWVHLGGKICIADKWIVNDGFGHYDADDYSKMSSFCSTTNDFLENYFLN